VKVDRDGPGERDVLHMNVYVADNQADRRIDLRGKQVEASGCDPYPHRGAQD
jgi:hypothetical protein